MIVAITQILSIMFFFYLSLYEKKGWGCITSYDGPCTIQCKNELNMLNLHQPQ